MLNCSHVDDVLAKVAYLQTGEGDETRFVLPVLVFAASLAFLVAGFRVFRGMVAAGTSVAALVASYSFLYDVDCVAKLVITGLAGLCALLLILCVLKVGLFLLGAAAFGATAHFVCDALPLDGLDLPEFQGRSAAHWLVVTISGTVGACVVYCNRDKVIVVVTSMLGAAGVSVGASMLVPTEQVVSPWVWIVTSAALFAGGVAAQTRLKRTVAQRGRRKVKRTTHADDDYTDDEEEGARRRRRHSPKR